MERQPVTFEQLGRRIAAEQSTGHRHPLLVAIDGRGGSGKTVLADKLAQSRSDVSVVHTDDFAKPRVRGWESTRFYKQVAEPLLAGRPGRYQRYDWDQDRLA